MIDENIQETLKEINKIFGIEAYNKITSHLFSLERKIEDLKKSRDNWKNKYEELKRIKEVKQ